MTEDSNRAPSSNGPQLSPRREEPPDEANRVKNWRDLARQAAQETDPQKLLSVVKDLCSALDSENKHANSQSDTCNSADGGQRPRPGSG